MVYILEVLKGHLEQATDMLRYDACYDVDEKADAYLVYTLAFTPDRWLSFGILPRVVTTWKLTASEEKEKWAQARGFTAGMRFAQKLQDAGQAGMASRP